MSEQNKTSSLRRIDMLRWTPAERMIYDAMQGVEDAGAHPLLTDAVILLSQAKDKVADYVDQSLPDLVRPGSEDEATKDAEIARLNRVLLNVHNDLGPSSDPKVVQARADIREALNVPPTVDAQGFGLNRSGMCMVTDEDFARLHLIADAAARKGWLIAEHIAGLRSLAARMGPAVGRATS